MSKFKVGDAVVPAAGDRHGLFNHWMEYWAKDGDVRPTKFYVVGFSDDGDYVIYNADRSATGGPHIFPRDLQLAPYTSNAAAEVDNLADEYGAPRKFKVGDRVRYTTTRPNYGAEPYSGELIIKEIGGGDWGDDVDLIYAGYQSGHYEQIARLVDIEHVTAAPTTLRIEAGKFYKTRDGRKVGPMDYRRDDDEHPWGGAVARDGAYYIFEANGINYIPGANDLIAEWTDEPVARAFPVSSRVVRDNGYKPDIYGTVTGHISDEYNTVKWDDNGGNSETWQDHELRLAAPTTIADIVARHSQTGTAIVCRLDNGAPRPAGAPFVHTTASAAETEATRLSRTNPGKEFGVYTLGAVAKVEKTYDHEWQRLAAKGERVKAVKALRDLAGMSLASAVSAVDFVKAAA